MCGRERNGSPVSRCVFQKGGPAKPFAMVSSYITHPTEQGLNEATAIHRCIGIAKPTEKGTARDGSWEAPESQMDIPHVYDHMPYI